MDLLGASKEMLIDLRTSILGKRSSKPREKGITMVLDKLSQPLSCLGLEYKAPYIDYVKIGWGLPLLIPTDMLRERIRLYHELDVDVGLSGTLMELATVKGRARDLFEEAWSLGFNVVEISSGIVDIPMQERLELADYARSLGFKVTFEVGKKDPSRKLPLRSVIEEIRLALESGRVWKVIIEGREFGKASCLFDEEGNLKSDWFSALISMFDHGDLIFEAPLVKQHVELIRRLGPNVNLGNIRMEDVLSLESLRLGVRGDTFLIKSRGSLTGGSPSEKFVLYVLKQFGPMSSSEIKRKTGLPSRTIYKALKNLKDKGLVEQLSLGGTTIWAASHT
ncbi:MAG: phosphosulfolactate synthase [Candidatus Korarchaeota archaeon]|nr:phosphosulfolactate synthase [Candidatus Korarchaeota archaeon]